MVTTRSTPIPTNTTKHSVPAAEIQPSMSETLDRHSNREEPAVELERNHSISEDLDLRIVWPSLEQELEDMSIEELETIKTQLNQKLYIANLKRQIL